MTELRPEQVAELEQRLRSTAARIDVPEPTPIVEHTVHGAQRWAFRTVAAATVVFLGMAIGSAVRPTGGNASDVTIPLRATDPAEVLGTSPLQWLGFALLVGCTALVWREGDGQLRPTLLVSLVVLGVSWTIVQPTIAALDASAPIVEQIEHEAGRQLECSEWTALHGYGASTQSHLTSPSGVDRTTEAQLHNVDGVHDLYLPFRLLVLGPTVLILLVAHATAFAQAKRAPTRFSLWVVVAATLITVGLLATMWPNGPLAIMQCYNE